MKAAQTTIIAVALAVLGIAAASAQTRVNCMPDGVKALTGSGTAYAWAGLSLDVWGSATGFSTITDATWDFGDATSTNLLAPYNPRYLSAAHAYGAAGTYYATLTVTGTDMSANPVTKSNTVRIDVLLAPDNAAQANLACERGLRWLYQCQQTDGSICNYGWYRFPSTCLALLAFENRGHLAVNDPAKDVYVPTIQAGLAYACSQLQYVPIPTTQPGGTCDTHGVYPAPAVGDSHCGMGLDRR